MIGSKNKIVLMSQYRTLSRPGVEDSRLRSDMAQCVWLVDGSLVSN